MSDFPVIDLVATGKNIKRLRKKSGLTVSELQRYFGFTTPQEIYKWQRGQSLPSVDHLFAMSRLFKVSMQDILVEEDQDLVFLSNRNSLFGGIAG